MKKVIFGVFGVVALSLGIWSCTKENHRKEEIKNSAVVENIDNNKALSVKSLSVGSLHNQYLDEFYQELSQIRGLDKNNIQYYLGQIFDRKRVDGQKLDPAEIEKIRYNVLDEELKNLSEGIVKNKIKTDQQLRDYVSNYTPLNNFSSRERIIFNNSKDVLYYSAIYWKYNIKKWYDLTSEPLPSNYVIYSWPWDEIWDSVKRIVQKDVEGAKDSDSKKIEGVATDAAISSAIQLVEEILNALNPKQ